MRKLLIAAAALAALAIPASAPAEASHRDGWNVGVGIHLSSGDRWRGDRWRGRFAMARRLADDDWRGIALARRLALARPSRPPPRLAQQLPALVVRRLGLALRALALRRAISLGAGAARPCFSLPPAPPAG